MTDARNRVRASFAAQGLMRTLGAELTMIGDGEVAIEAPLSPAITQQRGAAHGGAVFSLADSAAGYAALTVLPDEAEVATAEMKINFLAPADGALRATGRVVKAGRRLIVVTAEVRSGDVLVAVAQGTMIAVPREA